MLHTDEVPCAGEKVSGRGVAPSYRAAVGLQTTDPFRSSARRRVNTVAAGQAPCQPFVLTTVSVPGRRRVVTRSS